MNRDHVIDAYLASHAVVRTFNKDQFELLQRIFHSISAAGDDDYLRQAGTLMVFCNANLTDKSKFETQVAVIATKALEILFSNRSTNLQIDQIEK